MRVIRRIAEQAASRQVDFIIVAGDMFEDHNVDDLLVREVTDVLNSLDPMPSGCISLISDAVELCLSNMTRHSASKIVDFPASFSPASRFSPLSNEKVCFRPKPRQCSSEISSTIIGFRL